MYRKMATIKRLIISMILTVAAISLDTSIIYAANSAQKELRGVWLSYVDQGTYLKGKSRPDYESIFGKICDAAVDRKLNTIFVHVRSHNDSIYPSAVYPWSTRMLDGDPGFDPLQSMVEIAHEKGLKIHAWINPYGYRNGEYSEHPELSTNENVLAGVKEILDNYNVDGIHFDDYFPPIGEEMINEMMKAVHLECQNRGKTFGVSPQGSVENCLAAGANVKTWLSSTEYIDYIAPQIYWTNYYGDTSLQPMSSEKLYEWPKINTAGIPMYVGMALYRAGTENEHDLGWLLQSNNLYLQYQTAKEAGYTGYILYNTKAMMEPNAVQAAELEYLAKAAKTERKLEVRKK